ncbi:MAG: hypothetical protein AAB502_08445, partial [Chloroflexota bacterium]
DEVDHDEAAKIAQTSWVRVAANMGLGAYEVFTGSANVPEPVWPDVTFDALVKIAFKDHYINTSDHPKKRKNKQVNRADPSEAARRRARREVAAG